MGWYLKGLYIYHGMQAVDDRDGNRRKKLLVTVAVGRDAYDVYMDDENDIDYFDNLKVGDEVTLGCRLYVSKSGKLMALNGVVRE